jgi:3-phenylpropionate/trans-cinnamate dioxygenase ferredoxin subunit
VSDAATDEIPAGYQYVALVGEIGVKKTLCVEAHGEEVLICHTNDGFFAVDNLCSHAAEKLQGGRLKGHRLFCPLHGASFDIRTGEALTRPARKPLRSYPVLIRGDELYLGPTTAPNP